MRARNDAEAELLRLWRRLDWRGRTNVMDLARFEAEATAECAGTGWHVMDGGGRKTGVLQPPPADTDGSGE